MKRLYLSILIISLFSTIQSMETALKWTCRFTRGFSNFSSLFLPSGDALFFYNRPINQELPDLSPKTKEWVKAYLQSLGIQDPENIIYKMQPQHSWCVAGVDGIIAPQDDVEKLEQILNQDVIDENDELILDAKINIAHECSHLIKKDNEKRQKMLPLFALGSTILGDQVIKFATKNILKKYPKSFYGLVGSLSLFSVPVRIWATYQFDSLYQRNMERKADKFAFTHATEKELEYTIKDYKMRHEKFKDVLNNPENYTNFEYPWQYTLMKFFHKCSQSEKSFGDWIEHYPRGMKYIYYRHDNTHPTDYERMMTAQKHLASRKKQ